MGLADVAALAHVQRPVVSMWRKRSAGSARPFPDVIAVDQGRELFDADSVAVWLAATGRGNNPDAGKDAAAFASKDMAAFEGVSALLVLKVILRNALAGMSRDDLLDAADECDPDDRFIYRELESLGAALVGTALYADQLADAAYTAPAAFEKLLADRTRSSPGSLERTGLVDSAVRLVAAAGVELASTLDAPPAFVDASGGSDLLLAFAQRAGDASHTALLIADDGGSASRRGRRRLRVHSLDSRPLRVEPGGAFTVEGPAVHVAQYPSAGDPGIGPGGTLSAIENIALQMDDSHRAVIIAPAPVLCDAARSTEVSQLRSDLLRSGRVRAVVRLPQGLLRSKPREAQALWVLGPSFAEVGIADRWTMVADLSDRQLTADVSQDLISDIAASMGDHATVRAHSFRFARLVQTRVLLACRSSLVVTPQVSGVAQPFSGHSGPANSLLRIEELVRQLEPSRKGCLYPP